MPKPPPGTPAPPTRKSKIRENLLTPAEKSHRSFLVRQRPPNLHATNGFPVLQFPGHTQPARIATIILCKVKRKNNAVTLWKYMEDEGLQLCRYEDAWDRELLSLPGFRGGGRIEGELSWFQSGVDVVKRLKTKNASVEKKTMRVTARLQKIVERERERYKVWKLERTRKKRREARMRRAYRDAVKRAEEKGGEMPVREEYVFVEKEKERKKVKGPGPAVGWKRWRNERKNVPKRRMIGVLEGLADEEA